MKQSTFELIRHRIQRIQEEAIVLLKRYSAMTYGGDSIISPSGDHHWEALPDEGKRLQVRLQPELQRLGNLLTFLTAQLPGSDGDKVQRNWKAVREYVEQNTRTWCSTRDEAIVKLQELVSELLKTLEGYYGGPSGGIVVVPDTNSFLTHPKIESWRFEGVSAFEIVLAPTIVAELDRIKIAHRNDDVRRKAEDLIRKIKEYRRRGSLLEGVTVVRNMITLKALAIEPAMADSLPWFDNEIADDRFLATVLEVLRARQNAHVCIVTYDLNLQNKAEMAGVPFVEFAEDM